MVLRRPAEEAWTAEMARQGRAAAEVARQLDAALGPRVLRGVALDHATAAVESAARLLEQVARDGWPAVTGSVGGGGWGRMGADSVAPIAEASTSDSLERALG
jgi:hypothetical protein